MKISFLLSTLWLSGGVRDILEIANRLVDRGFQITFVVSGGLIDEEIRAEIRPEIQLQEAAYRPPGVNLSLWQKIRLTFSLFRAVPKTDILISTQTPTTATALLARVFSGVKTAWFYQDYIEMFLDRPLETMLVRYAFRWHDAAFVLSQHSKEELTGYYPGEVTVVQVGLSHPEHFRPASSEELAARKPPRRILFLSDMRPRKGLFEFLPAMAQVHAQIPELLLQIVSKDPCTIETDVPHEFIYRPDRADLARMYATCDVFVSASWWESFGIPPLEAMACGAPVVMTDSRGGREYARDRETCMLVPIRDPDALASAVLEVLQSPELEKKLRTNGPKMAARFTWEAAAEKFERGLRGLVQSASER